MAYKIPLQKEVQKIDFRKGWKKLRGMAELESPKELKKDIKHFEKHPETIYWNVTLDEPETIKKTFKGVKDFKGWKKTLKEAKQDLLTKKKEKGERGFWK
jgi:hypothetical protein